MATNAEDTRRLVPQLACCQRRCSRSLQRVRNGTKRIPLVAAKAINEFIGANYLGTGDELRKATEAKKHAQWMELFNEELAPAAEDGSDYVEWDYSEEFNYLPHWSNDAIESYTAKRGITYYYDDAAEVFGFRWDEE
eukprot:TRINITY_DN64983_c0_g1_i1.p2 TRINITY_DN64983_c0_g1~~TRINITY_DN64983_c0_g1_i1.p2  ORF type:complete len:137 (-),score=27.73 TRINITY_DN64983_c0_g1_i1:171-581(-)